MTDAYMAKRQEEAFDGAFEGFTTQPRPNLAMEPTPKAELLASWYLDPESGGPNRDVKKPGVTYVQSHVEHDDR
jgi:hypothetical protein